MKKRTVIAAMELRSFEPGDNVVTEGESAAELLVIMEGHATVFVKGNVVRDFGRLDIIGEIAMLPGNHVRGATVTA